MTEADDQAASPTPHVPGGTRDAHDAEDHSALKRDPSDADAKLDIELDETFPTSDPPSNTQPGRGMEPAPSSGFNDHAAPPPLEGQ